MEETALTEIHIDRAGRTECAGICWSWTTLQERLSIKVWLACLYVVLLFNTYVLKFRVQCFGKAVTSLLVTAMEQGRSCECWANGAQCALRQVPGDAMFSMWDVHCLLGFAGFLDTNITYSFIIHREATLTVTCSSLPECWVDISQYVS